MTININDKTIQIPTSWNELTLKQQSMCYSIIMTDIEEFEPFEPELIPLPFVNPLCHFQSSVAY